MVLNQQTTTTSAAAAASSSLFRPMPPVNDSNNMNDSDDSKLQMALDQILAGFQKENNTGNNMRQIPQDSALTQERALKALIIDRDNKVRQQIEATYAQQQEQLLHQILFSSPQQPPPPQQQTSQFEAFPPQQQNNWWLYPPPNFQITNGLKQKPGAYRSTIPKTSQIKQSAKENHFSPMPPISKGHNKPNRLFRSNGFATSDDASTPKRAPGMQFRTSRRISEVHSSSDDRKSRDEEEKSSSDATSDDSSVPTDQSYQNALQDKSPVSQFRPLLPEVLGPVAQSRSDVSAANAMQSTSKETELIMRIVTGSYKEIQEIINEYKYKNLHRK